VHVEWLHSYFTNYTLERLGRVDADNYSFWRSRAKVEKHVKIGFDVFEHGIVKRRVLEGDDEQHPNWRIGHCVVFPNMLTFSQIRVPMDDTHTLYWWYNNHPAEPGESPQRAEDIPVYEVPVPGVDKYGLPIWELVDNNSGQDNYAWASQGGVTPRWTEHLGESDKGLILYRRLLRDQMKLVEEGKDPINTFRDPATNVSVHVPNERDDPNWVSRSARHNQKLEKGAMSSGQSGKYSPVLQQRARRAGFAVPEGATEPATRVAGFGQIHSRS
jgi:5,5'-dehydrodivanillate O-demethylase oxygenase subunit